MIECLAAMTCRCAYSSAVVQTATGWTEVCGSFYLIDTARVNLYVNYHQNYAHRVNYHKMHQQLGDFTASCPFSWNMGLRTDPLDAFHEVPSPHNPLTRWEKCPGSPTLRSNS